MLAADTTRLLHLNHWCVVAGSGYPTQVPGETESSLPVILFPVTIGLTVAKGGPVTIAVEDVNLTVVPIELFPVTRYKTCLPMASLSRDATAVETGTGVSLRAVLPFPSWP